MEITYQYLAGLIDGEGCLMISKATRIAEAKRGIKFCPVMSVANNYLPLMEKIMLQFGGKIRNQGKPIQKVYNIYFSSNEIRELLPKLLPYLIVKKSQAEILLSYLEKMQQNGYRNISDELFAFYEECYEKLKQIKRIRFDYDKTPKEIGKLICPICKKEFIVFSNHPHKKFCSTSCKLKDCWTRSNARIRQDKLDLVNRN